jgi:intermembrane space import and assembly protein 40
MQDCFREHPEMYGSELEDDEEEVEEELRVQAAEKEAASPVQSEAAPIASIAEQATAKLTTEESITVAKSDDKTKKGGDQGSELVPKDAVDAPAQN